MTTKKQYEWLLEGIDCANCAAKVEHAVGKIEGVSASNVNFMTKTLQFELDQPTEQQLNRVKETIHQVEPDVTTLDKKTGQPIGQNIDDHHDHDHHDHHGHNHGDSNVSHSIIRLVVTLIVLVVAVFAPLESTLSLMLFIVAYLVAGYDVIWTAIRNLFNGKIFDENFLMTVATLSAFYIREFPEAVSVMLFYQIGELFQDIAVDRSRRSIADLMAIRPDYANLKQADG
ncbi:MAG TPA: cation transporter, partial [Candidatus Jeotgalibaca merdavium]|nr:cation transporter [Candidatus Jeotgalibaca merdavium]